MSAAVAVSSHATLNVMFWVALIFTPTVLAYTGWAWPAHRARAPVEGGIAGGGIMEEVPWLITWNETLGLGIAEVDEDHQRFISLVNELNRAIVSRRDKAEIRQRLEAMVADASKHFEREERLLAENGYPDAARHARVHADLMSRIGAAMVYFNSAGWSQVWIEKGLLIKNLLIEHLLEEDMKYRDFLSARLTQPSAHTPAHPA